MAKPSPRKQLHFGLALFVFISLLGLTFIPGTQRVFASGATYYVDSVGGSDNNDGLSTASPWQSLSKVNSTTFSPGDRVLFKAGDTWNGQLHPLGSGNSSASITIDMYSSGNKPVIAGGGSVADTVYLYNQQYWDINNLEVTNDSATASLRTGVHVVAQDVTVASHIHISDLYVHNIKGIVNGYYGDNAGISVVVKSSNTFPNNHWDDVLIQRNTITTVDRIGVFVGPDQDGANVGRATNVVIQNNTISDSGGDAILTYVTSGALVQYNVAHDDGGRAQQSCQPTGYCNQCSADMWTAYSDHGVFQYNEAYNDQNGCDGEGFDIDWGTSATIFQYNYSHNNRGFLLECRTCSSTTGTDAIVRYNISQNERSCVLCFAPGQLPSGSLQVYNNTFYVGAGLSTAIIATYDGNPLARSFSFINNIIDNQGSGGYVSTPGTTYDYNLFFGNHPSSEPNDPDKLTANPLFTNPGSGAAGRNTLNGYQLQVGSPALGSGTLISGNGGQDFYGNAVSSTSAPNRGAYNGAGVSGTSTNLVVDPGYEQQTSRTLSTPWSSDQHDPSNCSAGADIGLGHAHSGTNNGWISCNGNNQSGQWAAQAQFIPVTPNTTYTLSVWVYNDTGSIGNAAKIEVASVPWSNPRNVQFTASQAGYAQETLYFTTLSSETQISIEIGYNAPSGAATDLRVDDWSLTTNLVADPGYEQQSSQTLSSPWGADLQRDSTNCTVGVDVGVGNARSGNNNSWLHCNGNNQAGVWAAQVQFIPVTPNTTYTLSVWVYNDAGSIGNAAKIEVASVPWSNPRNVQFTASQAGYAQETLHFTTLSSETQISVEIGYNAPSGAVTDMRVDDWSLSVG